MRVTTTIIGLDNIQEKLKKRTKINEIVKMWMKSGKPDNIMNRSFLKTFELEGRPTWKKLSAYTIKERLRLGFSASPILVRTGKLKKAVTTMSGDIHSFFNRNIIEWGANQLSGEDREKFITHQLGKKNPIKGYARIPQRKMIEFHKEDVATISESLSNWIKNKIK